MRQTCATLLVTLLTFNAYAGEDEFHLIDFHTCKFYTLTSDLGETYFRKPGEQEAWESQQRTKFNSPPGPNWGAFELQSHLGAEQYSRATPPSRIFCAVQDDAKQQVVVRCLASGAPLPSFTCPVPGFTGSHTCDTGNAVGSSLTIYGLDNREYEEGGNPVPNRRLEKALTRIKRGCKR